MPSPTNNSSYPYQAEKTFSNYFRFNNIGSTASLYSKAYLVMMSISLLNPNGLISKRLETTGKSIQEVFEKNLEKIDDLFTTHKLTGWKEKVYLYIHRPTAAVSRVALSYVLCCSFAPLGVAINGSICLFYIAKIGSRFCIQQADKHSTTIHRLFVKHSEELQEAQKADIKNLQFYALGLFTDCLMSGTALAIYQLIVLSPFFCELSAAAILWGGVSSFYP